MTLSQQIEQVLDAAIEELRQTSFVPFWEASINLSLDDELADLFRGTTMAGNRVRKELEIAAAEKEFDSFDLIITDGRRHYYGNTHSASIQAKLKQGSEWDAALREAWCSIDNPNDWFLTNNALRMLHWLQGPKNTGEFSPGNKIGAQAGLRGSGSYSKIGTYLEEISLKSPYHVSFERTSNWHADYKAEIEPKTEKCNTEEFSNPVFEGCLRASDRDSVIAYAEMLKDGILKADIKDTEPFLLFNIRSRVDLLHALPDLANRDEFSRYEFKQFLTKVRLTRGLNVAATLADVSSEGWRLGAVLDDNWTWDRARQVIQEQRQRDNPEKTYGLSPKAAKILVWILDLHDGEFELGMTPSVEGRAEEQMGIDDLKYDQNSKAILMLLIDEINEKTPYALRLIPWRECGNDHHRILVRQDPEDDEDLVKKIRIRGLAKGVHLKTSQVDQALQELWKSGSADK